MDSNKFDDLIIQSGLIADGCWDKFDQYDKEAIMKFAELLIKECSSIADDWVNNYNDGENYPSERIKEHFGVKE